MPPLVDSHGYGAVCLLLRLSTDIEDSRLPIAKNDRQSAKKRHFAKIFSKTWQFFMLTSVYLPSGVLGVLRGLAVVFAIALQIASPSTDCWSP